MNMEDRENPYDLLGVSQTANAQEIRSAYRKLALQHHPDKQRNEDDRARATVTFAKIANAYELLTDAERRKQYDLQQQQERHHFSTHQDGGGGFPNSFHDAFHQHHHFHGFHDPFQVFEQVFREEFGTRRGGQPRPAETMDPFMQDPFFQRGFGAGMMDPFAGFGGGSLFGNRGGGGRDPFQDMFTSIQQQMEQDFAAAQGGGGGANNNNNNRQTFVYSSSTSSRLGGGGGNVESLTTTTRMINGKKQTVTERVVRKPDGSLERQVETSGDDDFNDAHRLAVEGGLFPHGLPSSSSSSRGRKQQPIEDDNEPEQPTQRRFLPWGGGGRRRSTRKGKDGDAAVAEDSKDDRPAKSRKRS